MLRWVVQFAGLMAAGMLVAVLWLGYRSGFDASGAAIASGRLGFDVASYAAGLAVGILITSVLQVGLTQFARWLARCVRMLAPGAMLTTFAVVCLAILVFY